MEIKSITRYPFGDIVKSTRSRGDAKAGAFATRSRVLARLALLTQIGELARRLANYLWLNSSLLGRWGWRTDWDKRHNSPHVRESGFWNPGNFCLWNRESKKILLVESGILGSGIRNTAQRIGNPTINDGSPESKLYWQRLGSSTWNPEPTAFFPESKTVLNSVTWRGHNRNFLFSLSIFQHNMFSMFSYIWKFWMSGRGSHKNAPYNSVFPVCASDP